MFYTIYWVCIQGFCDWSYTSVFKYYFSNTWTGLGYSRVLLCSLGVEIELSPYKPPSSSCTKHISPTCTIPSSVSAPCSASTIDMPQALLPPGLQRTISQQLHIPEQQFQLPCKHGSKCNQHFGRNFLPPRKSDSRRLFGQLPSPGLQHRLYRFLDISGEILIRSQIRHPKPDCHHALQTTSWHWPWCVV